MSAPLYTAYLEGELKLTARGEWWHRGQPFLNRQLSDLFHRSIVWDDHKGCYYVRIGKQQATFTVEDCAYFITHIDDQQTPWLLELNDQTREPLIPATLWTKPDGRLYTQVKKHHRALFLSAPYQILVRHTVDEHTLEIAGQKIPLNNRR